MRLRIEPLQIVLSEIQPQIVVLSEHDMRFYETERVNILNYDITSFFCRNNSPKGGVMILSEEHLEWTPVTFPKAIKLCEEKVFEFCTTLFKLEGFNLLVIGLQTLTLIPF